MCCASIRLFVSLFVDWSSSSMKELSSRWRRVFILNSSKCCMMGMRMVEASTMQLTSTEGLEIQQRLVLMPPDMGTQPAWIDDGALHGHRQGAPRHLSMTPGSLRYTAGTPPYPRVTRGIGRRAHFKRQKCALRSFSFQRVPNSAIKRRRAFGPFKPSAKRQPARCKSW